MDKLAQVLDHLREEQKRLTTELAGIERAIAALEAAAGGDWIPAASARATQAPAPYARLNVYEAAASYLKAAGEPRTTREIADALRAGGYPTRSQSFAGTVGTMLRRRETTTAYGIKKTDNGKRWFVRK